ncbi:tRNA (adenosine(37)-N6)-threonylcarbamoyltransferase complex dimerization subunit type 1 TsaB [Candidatus Microgenomates bacterium]|nr:tRNA (adenosine(37)-N6)-threonylcarbamoyltransferase complex dimerization subunit type 1 TsaB [Candidatus Microgenomates bacterium]
MKLFIDTSHTEEIVVGLDNDRVRTDSRQEKAQKLLSVIEDLLKSHGFTFGDLKEVEVVSGPGSFTGLRVGIAVANALGWALNIPVNGQNVREQPVAAKYQ